MDNFTGRIGAWQVGERWYAGVMAGSIPDALWEVFKADAEKMQGNGFETQREAMAFAVSLISY